jgi:hypothetical protein
MGECLLCDNKTNIVTNIPEGILEPIDELNQHLSSYTLPMDCEFYQLDNNEVCCNSYTSSGFSSITQGCYYLN